MKHQPASVRTKATEPVQQIKALNTQAWQPELDPEKPCKGEWREPTPQSNPLTAACMPCHMHPHIHIKHECVLCVRVFTQVYWAYVHTHKSFFFKEWKANEKSCSPSTVVHTNGDSPWETKIESFEPRT